MRVLAMAGLVALLLMANIAEAPASGPNMYLQFPDTMCAGIVATKPVVVKEFDCSANEDFIVPQKDATGLSVKLMTRWSAQGWATCLTPGVAGHVRFDDCTDAPWIKIRTTGQICATDQTSLSASACDSCLSREPGAADRMSLDLLPCDPSDLRQIWRK